MYRRRNGDGVVQRISLRPVDHCAEDGEREANDQPGRHDQQNDSPDRGLRRSDSEYTFVGERESGHEHHRHRTRNGKRGEGGARDLGQPAVVAGRAAFGDEPHQASPEPEVEESDIPRDGSGEDPQPVVGCPKMSQLYGRSTRPTTTSTNRAPYRIAVLRPSVRAVLTMLASRKRPCSHRPEVAAVGPRWLATDRQTRPPARIRLHTRDGFQPRTRRLCRSGGRTWRRHERLACLAVECARHSAEQPHL